MHNHHHQPETKVGIRSPKFWSFILRGMWDLGVLLKELLQKMWDDNVRKEQPTDVEAIEGVGEET